MAKAIFNWSGGKDSALALYKIQIEKKIEVSSLLTTLNKKNKRVSGHGIRESLLDLQSKNMSIPINKIFLPDDVSNETYEKMMKEYWEKKKNEGINYCISGDIFLEDVKEYREKQLSMMDIQSVFPLWKMNSNDVLKEFIDLGFKSIVVCINEKYLDSSFVGRIINADFVADLPPNIDPCGENGEYHSFVFDGPIFKKPVDFKVNDKIYIFKEYKEHNYSGGFWNIELTEI
ncbi:MAG TPA: diphthine--ammonia ligase [Bacteroidales bacterium]|nr:diphthine--ammonia ligase [Bacteroidales bacterium]